MEPQIPQYVEARIRRETPPGTPVLQGSTPIPSFGDLRTAKIATIGWNPSKREFVDTEGRELQGDQRRLETLRSLGVPSLSNASPESVFRVFASCNAYFTRSPYWWFKKLDAVLRPLGATYYGDDNGKLESACHLDIVQNATDPAWGNLNTSIRGTLIDLDIPFLREQLASSDLRIVLLNGMGIIRAFEELVAGSPLTELESLRFGRIRLFKGNSIRGFVPIGWNINLQTTYGVSCAELERLGSTVARAIDG